MENYQKIKSLVVKIEGLNRLIEKTKEELNSLFIERKKRKYTKRRKTSPKKLAYMKEYNKRRKEENLHKLFHPPQQDVSQGIETEQFSIS